MSVKEVNNADSQFRTSSSLPYAAAGTALLGVAGAGSGYMWGGKTPSLEEVFAQEADTFDRESFDPMKEKDQPKAETVKKAYTDYKAKEQEKQTAIDAAKENQKKAIEKITDYDNKTKLEQDLTTAKDARANAKKTVNGTEITYSEEFEKELKTAEKELKDLKADADATARENATNKVNAAKAKVNAFADETKAVKEAEKAIFDAKETKFKADTSDEAKNIRQALSNAEEELKKLFENSVDKETKDAYNSVKKALTTGRTKAALIYGGIAAAVGLAAGLLLGKSKKAEAPETTVQEQA